jgi:hypothetical protein
MMSGSPKSAHHIGLAILMLRSPDKASGLRQSGSGEPLCEMYIFQSACLSLRRRIEVKLLWA